MSELEQYRWTELPSVEDLPLHWWQMDLCLKGLIAKWREDRPQAHRLSGRQKCFACQQWTKQGAVLDALDEHGVVCPACISTLEKIVRLYGVKDGVPEAPAFFSYERDLSSYYRVLGIIWFAAAARRYGIRPGPPLLVDLAAAAVVKRFFRDIVPDEQPTLFYWARAALLSIDKCITCQLFPLAIKAIHATDIVGPIGSCPRALTRPMFMEIGVDPEARLFGNTIFLGWYLFQDNGYILGVDANWKVRQVCVTLDWKQPLDQILAAVEANVADPVHRDWAREATRFLIVMALFQQSYPPPLLFDEQPVRPSTLPGGRPQDDGFVRGRLIDFDRHWRRLDDVSDESAPGVLSVINYEDIPITVWSPARYDFQRFAQDCAEIAAALRRCRRLRTKSEDVHTILYALSMIARAETSVDRWTDDGVVAVEYAGTTWTPSRCRELIASAVAARPKLLIAVRPFVPRRVAPSVRRVAAATVSSTDVDRNDDEIASLRQAFEEANARAVQMEKLARAQEEALQRLQSAEQKSGPTIDEEAHRALKRKVDRLKALIDEGNAERRELRRRLAEVDEKRTMTATPSSISDAEDDDRDEQDFQSMNGDAPSRGVRIPTFSRQAQSALEAVPKSIAASALRLLAELGSGDSAAWRNVKQAKDMPRRVLMARLGIHHRLLFTVDREGVIEALDLVPRERLDLTLKGLRAMSSRA